MKATQTWGFPLLLAYFGQVHADQIEKRAPGAAPDNLDNGWTYQGCFV